MEEHFLFIEDRPEDWKFFQEGGANWVFAYCGSNTTFVNKILRISKRPCNIQASLSLYRHIISKFFDESLGISFNVAKFSKDFLEALLRESANERRNENGFSNLTDYGLLCDNLHGSDCDLTIEIKPKWGKPTPLDDLSICTCRYCRNYREEFNRSSAYCPRLFFSRDPVKITTAIDALMHGGGKSNQLKVYRRGQLSSPATVSMKERNMLISILTSHDVLLKVSETLQRLLDTDKLQFQDLERLSHLNDEDFELEFRNHIDQINCSSSIKFLIGVALQDCSIIVQFRADEALVKIIDLDLKPYKKALHYYQQTD